MQSILDGLIASESDFSKWSCFWTSYVEECRRITALPAPSRSLVRPFDLIPKLPPDAFRKIQDNFGGVFYECSFNDCRKRYSRRAENAKAHWLMHLELSPFKCDLCAFGFRRKHDLKRHKSAHHNIADSI